VFWRVGSGKGKHSSLGRKRKRAIGAERAVELALNYSLYAYDSGSSERKKEAEEKRPGFKLGNRKYRSGVVGRSCLKRVDDANPGVGNSASEGKVVYSDIQALVEKRGTGSLGTFGEGRSKSPDVQQGGCTR